MAFHFHCSFLAVHRFKRRVVADGRLVAWFYVRHGSFLVDLLSILPILELVPAAPWPPPPPPPLPFSHACPPPLDAPFCTLACHAPPIARAPLHWAPTCHFCPPFRWPPGSCLPLPHKPVCTSNPSPH